MGLKLGWNKGEERRKGSEKQCYLYFTVLVKVNNLGEASGHIPRGNKMT